MAAGLGFKTFTTGEVLTAADTNGYLMQGVLVFASSAARAAAITSPQEGQYSYLKDTNSTEYYDGAAWIAAPIGDITGVTAGVGISGGGTSGTVTVTNDMATTITAAGDIVVGTGSGTYDNLPIGTTAQVLTADTTVSPYKVKWATPSVASSGMTLIKQASFSNVATTTTTFDSVFSSTYLSYLVTIDRIYAATSADNLQIQWLYSGSTQAGGYYGASLAASVYGTSPVTTGTANEAQLTIYAASGASAATGSGHFYVTGAYGTSDTAIAQGMFLEGTDIGEPAFFGGRSVTNRTYTGFLLKSSSSNITGTVSVYGLAK